MENTCRPLQGQFSIYLWSESKLWLLSIPGYSVNKNRSWRTYIHINDFWKKLLSWLPWSASWFCFLNWLSCIICLMLLKIKCYLDPLLLCYGFGTHKIDAIHFLCLMGNGEICSCGSFFFPHAWWSLLAKWLVMFSRTSFEWPVFLVLFVSNTYVHLGISPLDSPSPFLSFILCLER